MSKYKYFLKVTYSYGILEENAEKEEAYQELERLELFWKLFYLLGCLINGDMIK